jgi:uncharacterized protein YjbJ (UPF0337 family)
MVTERSNDVKAKGFALAAIWPLHVHCPRSQTLADLTMNKLQFKGEWHELKGKLRQKFAELTDNDVDYAEGQEEELLGHLQQKLGKSQQEIAELINSP